MKTMLVLSGIFLFLWPILSWFTYRVSGWWKWERLFHRQVTKDVIFASAVATKKFGSYNHAIKIGIEEYGVAFQPTVFLLFHKSFAIPWSQIMSFSYSPRRTSRLCLLRTNQGEIRIYGDVAEIVARGCAGHYVEQQQL